MVDMEQWQHRLTTFSFGIWLFFLSFIFFVYFFSMPILRIVNYLSLFQRNHCHFHFSVTNHLSHWKLSDIKKLWLQVMRKIQWNHKWKTSDMNRLFYVVTRLFTQTKTKRISRFSKCKTINDRILHSNFCRIRKKEHEQISSKFTKDLNYISTWFKCDRWMMQRLCMTFVMKRYTQRNIRLLMGKLVWCSNHPDKIEEDRTWETKEKLNKQKIAHKWIS